MLKSLAMAALGLLLGMIGIDQMSGYFRFAYGVVELGDGIGVVPVAVGLFGVAEILAHGGASRRRQVIKPRLRELLPSRAGVARVRGADRARHRARLPDRHPAGLGAHHLELRLLRGRERGLEASRGVRQGRGGRRRRAGVGQQRGDLGAFVPMLALGVPSGADPGRDAGRADGARRLARARS